MPTHSIQKNADLTAEIGQTLEKKPELSTKVGHLLKSTREAKKISIEDACKTLKIRKFFLENIEKGDFEKLPGTVYTLGFIKSYSVYLGVDFEELSDELTKLTTSLEKDVALSTYSLPQPKNLLTKKALWGSVFLTTACIAAYFTYYANRSETSIKAELTEKSVEPIREKIEMSKQIPVEKSLAVGADRLAVPNSEVITISANKETWIRIVDANNQLIVARLLRPQGFYRLNAEDGFRLTTAEAGAIDIYLGDEKLNIPSLKGNDLLENIPIDGKNLKQYSIKPVVVPQETSPQSEIFAQNEILPQGQKETLPQERKTVDDYFKTQKETAAPKNE
ncbi:MAG: DUF4115 domain-containing protein [Alphaproteobacteria bacterium]|nr:DUF4115 domain-containing protein [Alphaproteobacteria bacterium]